MSDTPYAGITRIRFSGSTAISVLSAGLSQLPRYLQHATDNRGKFNLSFNKLKRPEQDFETALRVSFWWILKRNGHSVNSRGLRTILHHEGLWFRAFTYQYRA